MARTSPRGGCGRQPHPPGGGAKTTRSNTTIGVFVQQQFGWQDRLFRPAPSGRTTTARLVKTSTWSTTRSPAAPGWSAKSCSGILVSEPVPVARLRRVRPAATDLCRPADLSPVTGPGDGYGHAERCRQPGPRAPNVARRWSWADAGSRNERLGLEFTYYNQRTWDAILLRDVAPSTGVLRSQFINAGRIQHGRGVARLQAITTPRLGWTTPSVATNENEI